MHNSCVNISYNPQHLDDKINNDLGHFVATWNQRRTIIVSVVNGLRQFGNGDR